MPTSSQPLRRDEIANKDVYDNITDGAGQAVTAVTGLNEVMTKTLTLSNSKLKGLGPISEKATADQIKLVNRTIAENQKIRKATLAIQKQEVQLKLLQKRLAKEAADRERKTDEANKKARKEETKASQERQKQIKKEAAERERLSKEREKQADRAEKERAKEFSQTRAGRKATIQANAAKEKQIAALKREAIAERENGKSKNALKNRINELTARLDTLTIGSRAYRKTLKETRKAQNQLNKEMEKAGKSGGFVGRYTRALRNVPAALGITSGLIGFVAAVRDAIKIVADFDSGLIKVGKTANLTDLEKTQLGQSTIALSRSLDSISTTKLFELQEVAGQLGVKGTENLLRFSEVLARLEKSTNVQGQEGATALARIINITGEDISTVDQFGSALVDLGNNSAASEAEILATANEVARATAAYDLASTSVLGISAALTSLGAKPESAGSAIGSFFIEIEKAILSGGNDLKKFADVLGITSDELLNLFSKDKEQVFTQFIQGLGEIDAAGGSITTTLSELDLADKRVLKSLSPLAKNYEVLSKSVDLSNTAYEENTALVKESDEALGSIQSQIDSVAVSWANYINTQDSGNGVLSQSIRFVTGLTNALFDLATGIDENEKQLTDQQKRFRLLAEQVTFFAKAIGLLVLSIGAYRAILFTVNLVQRTWITLMATSRIATAAFAGGVRGATKAFVGLNAATKANILLGVISLITTLVLAFKAFKDGANAAARAQRNLNAAQQEGLSTLDRIKSLRNLAVISKKITDKQLKDALQNVEAEKDAILDLQVKKLALEETFADRESQLLDEISEKGESITNEDLERLDNLLSEEQTAFQTKIGLRNQELTKAKEDLFFARVVLEAEQARRIKQEKETIKEIETARLKSLKSIKAELIDFENKVDEAFQKKAAPFLAAATKSAQNSVNKAQELDRIVKSIAASLHSIEQENLTFDAETASPERRKEIQKQILVNEAEFQIDLIEQSVLNEEEKAAKILEINNKLQNDLKRLQLESQKDLFEQARKHSQNILNEVNREFDKRAALRLKAKDDEIQSQQQQLTEAIKLAKDGDENLLAFRRQELAKAQLERRDELKKQQQFEEALKLSDIFLDSFSNRISNNQSTGEAGAGALADTFLAKGLSKIFLSLAGFKDGTIDTGTVSNALDRDGARPVLLHNNERVIPKHLNKMLGGISNEDAARIIYNERLGGSSRNRDVKPTKNPQLERLIKTIENKPVTSLDLTNYGDFVRTEIQGQITKIIKSKQGRRYFNGN